MFIAYDAADFSSSVRSGICYMYMPLLAELENKNTPRSINIALLAELKAARCGQMI
jgi:hypothetical protein